MKTQEWALLRDDFGHFLAKLEKLKNAGAKSRKPKNAVSRREKMMIRKSKKCISGLLVFSQIVLQPRTREKKFPAFPVPISLFSSSPFFGDHSTRKCIFDCWSILRIELLEHSENRSPS